MYYQRTLTSIIENASRSFKVVILSGPRQVGKSTLLNKLIDKNRVRVSLDDSDALTLAKQDPNMFFQVYKPPLLIDEVQRAPELLLYIKKLVDDTHEKGLFWLTGSQKFSLMQSVSESLAGRVAILDIQGLSQAEKNRTPNSLPFTPDIPLNTHKTVLQPIEVFNMIHKGSYPQLFDGTTDWNLYYKSYVETYLMRDVKEIVNIDNELNFIRFLKVIAARSSQIINYADIARDVGISPNTIKNWISILQTLGIIYLLQPYYINNVGKRFIKSPKLYFMDTGLCSYLCMINDSNTLFNSSLSGEMFETYAVSEIIKSYIHNGKTPYIYYLRTSNGEEIDIVIEENNKVYPIEIKKTSTPTISMSKNFKLIKEDKRGIGCILCLSDKFIPMSRDVYTIPISYI